jgi:hypothetical protein
LYKSFFKYSYITSQFPLSYPLWTR